MWDDEDARGTATASSSKPLASGQSEIISMGSASSTGAGAERWNSTNLAEGDLVQEKKSLGPITERLLSALLEVPPGGLGAGGMVAAPGEEDGPEPAETAAHVGPSVLELESRLRTELRAVGLMGDDNVRRLVFIVPLDASNTFFVTHSSTSVNQSTTKYPPLYVRRNHFYGHKPA